MWRYVLKRLAWMIVIVIGVALVIFTITYLTPGDPARLQLGETATVEEVEALRHQWGLDLPFMAQFGNFLYNSFIKWDWGISWTYNVPVMEEFASRLPRTMGMGLANMLVGIAFGIPLGIMAARHQGSFGDYGVMGLSMVFISLPGFWVALECVLIFSLRLGWLPGYGIGGLQYYIVPVASGALAGIALTARQMRSSMLEVIRADYVTTARAKGQREGVIVRKHMLPNALMPIITLMGGQFAGIVAGQTITEKVFSIPGVGLYLLNGISYRDYPIIRSCSLFFAIFSSLVMLLTDLVYAWLDPRIKAQYASGGGRK